MKLFSDNVLAKYKGIGHLWSIYQITNKIIVFIY